MTEPKYALEFYRDRDGRQPVRVWLRDDLDRSKARALGVAMHYILQKVIPLPICDTTHI